MPLIGIIAKKKDIKAIKKELKDNNIEIMEITKESIKNFRNIKFDEIVFLQSINIKDYEIQYLKEIVSNSNYLIQNGDIEINILENMEFNKPIKFITIGFNQKSTITVSSINDNKILACLQRDIEKVNGEIIEVQEKQIIRKKDKNIYNSLVVFIINELHKA